MTAPHTAVLVEDDPGISRLIATILDPANYDVITVADGNDAVPLIADVQPDVVLLDIALPGRNGWEILTDLREQAGTAEIPVIVVTAHGQSGWEEKAIDLGASAYIEKPFRMRQLLDAVEAVEAD